MGNTLCAIDARDIRNQRQLDALLQAEGIRRDRNLSYTCGVFDGDMRLIATGSLSGNTLRCLAVSSDHRGEHLMNEVVTHLLERQLDAGNTHVFLYTKPSGKRIFEDMGFFEIARAEGETVFMENRSNGFSRYLKELEKTGRPGRSAAIVMNANPFTLGHRYLIEQAASENDWVHLFLLSEEAGPIPYAVRRKLTKDGIRGLDNVILHDSGPYIISSATFPSYFLRDGDAAILAHAQLDLAVFGRIASALGVVARYAGEEPASHVTRLYNESMASQLPGMGIAFREVPRLKVDGRTVSAGAVRKAIRENRLPDAADMLPETTLSYFENPEAAPVISAIRKMDEARHY